MKIFSPVHKAEEDKFTLFWDINTLRFSYHAQKQKNNSSEFKPYEIRDLTIAAVCSVVRKTWIWCSQCLTGAWVRVCTGCSPGARMPTRICYLPCPWAAPAWQAWYENNIFPPSSPQLDRSINLNQSFVLAAAVTDVSYFITVSQSSFVGWRAKLLWLNELLNH